MRRWYSLYNLPLAIGALMLLIPWFYLSWNTTVGELLPSVRFRTKQTLAGLVQEAAPTMDFHSVVSGRWQRSVSRAVGVLSPIFKPSIQIRNSLTYALFGAAASEGVLVGRKQQIFEATYIEEYCARDTARMRTRAENWAARIRVMQDAFHARGQAFLYVITPSKAAVYPQYIPESYTCPAAEADRREKLVVYGEILRRRGVDFLDAATGLAAAGEVYGIDMFPRGGIHWNALGAALGTQGVIAALNRQGPPAPLPTFDFTWRVSYNPSGADRDVLDLMNLPHPDLHYPVPELSYRSAVAPEGCRPMRITEIGGSFLMAVNATLGKLACAPEITYWFYWEQRCLRYAKGRMLELAVDAAARRRSLLDADAVIFEENEAAGPVTDHGRWMMDELKAIDGDGGR